MLTTDILIFVEDPGAANYVAQLPAALTERGWHTRLLAVGHAKDYLLQRGVSPEVVQHPAVADQILVSARPRLLIVGTSENEDTLGLELVAEAHSAGIESIGVVDGPGNADYRFRGRSDDPLAYAPDWLLVPDEWTKNAYVARGYPAERAVVCGHPHYDFVRAVGEQLAKEGRRVLRQRMFPEALDDRKVVIFVAEVSTGLSPQQFQRSAEYTLTGWGTSTGRTEIVLEELLDAVELVKPKPYFVLRLHPKNTLDEFRAYLDKLDLVSKGVSPLELVYGADLVVGMTSMLLLEAALLGRSTLSILPRVAETEWLASIRAGLTLVATTRKEVRAHLVSSLGKHAPKLKAKQKKLLSFSATQECVRFIHGILSAKET